MTCSRRFLALPAQERLFAPTRWPRWLCRELCDRGADGGGVVPRHSDALVRATVALQARLVRRVVLVTRVRRHALATPHRTRGTTDLHVARGDCRCDLRPHCQALARFVRLCAAARTDRHGLGSCTQLNYSTTGISSTQHSSAQNYLSLASMSARRSSVLTRRKRKVAEVSDCVSEDKNPPKRQKKFYGNDNYYPSLFG